MLFILFVLGPYLTGSLVIGSFALSGYGAFLIWLAIGAVSLVSIMYRREKAAHMSRKRSEEKKRIMADFEASLKRMDWIKVNGRMEKRF